MRQRAPATVVCVIHQWYSIVILIMTGWLATNKATLCPIPVGNAVLSSTCRRQIGDSCTFFCTRGFVPTTSDNIICTSDGTWNLDTATLCLDKLGPFLSKENAALYLKGRSNRVKRGINEECSESGGCSYEEIREIGVTDVCTWMKNRLCSELNCPVEYLCVTTIGNCINLNYYRVECQVLGCNESLVDTVTDDKLTASSKYGPRFTADKARLSSNGWIQSVTDSDPWIQVDFGRPAIIVAVVTKGSNTSIIDGYVEKYRVEYKNTTLSWNTVQYGTTNEFEANSNGITAELNHLTQPIVARFLRLNLTSCINYCRLRFDVIGCKVPITTSTTLSSQTTSITSSKPTSATTLSSQTTSITSNKPTSATALSSQTTSITSSKPTSATTLSSQTTSITSSKPTIATALSSQTTPITSSKPTSATAFSSQTTSFTSSKPTSATALSLQTTSITSSKPTSATALSSLTTSITSSKPTSATTLSSQTTSITSSKPTSATALSSQTTSITSSKPTSATALSSQTTSITSSKPTSATTLSSQTTSITSSKPTSATAFSSQTTSITSSKPTSATALSSQTTSITSSKPTSATTLSSQTTSITSSKPTSATTLSSQTTSITLNSQTIVATTPTKSFNSTQAGLCSCTCTQTNFSITPQAVQAKIGGIVQNLTVSKKKTSRYIRSKTSAQDTRPEVVYVGSGAIAILCLFASLIVLPDIFTLLRFLYSVLIRKQRNIRKVFKRRNPKGKTYLSTV